MFLNLNFVSVHSRRPCAFPVRSNCWVYDFIFRRKKIAIIRRSSDDKNDFITVEYDKARSTTSNLLPNQFNLKGGGGDLRTHGIQSLLRFLTLHIWSHHYWIFSLFLFSHSLFFSWVLEWTSPTRSNGRPCPFRFILHVIYWQNNPLASLWRSLWKPTYRIKHCAD